MLQPLRALGNSASRDPDRLVPLVAEVVADGRGMHNFLQCGCALCGHLSAPNHGVVPCGQELQLWPWRGAPPHMACSCDLSAMRTCSMVLLICSHWPGLHLLQVTLC